MKQFTPWQNAAACFSCDEINPSLLVYVSHDRCYSGSVARYLESRCFTESSSERTTAVRLKKTPTVQQALTWKKREKKRLKLEMKTGHKNPVCVSVKLEQVLWQNEQNSSDVWASICELPRLCSPAKLEMLWNIPLRPVLVIYVERYLLSRSTIGYEHIHFWFGLTRVDVIQLESVPMWSNAGFFLASLFRRVWPKLM